ncbi:hypothetical protein THAOC_14248, partial [Thalassiosira oceanica]
MPSSMRKTAASTEPALCFDIQTVHRLPEEALDSTMERRRSSEVYSTEGGVARDFPVPTQASNDSGLGARTDVLGEVKTLQPSKTSYDKGNCQTNRPVNLRATQAVRSYRRRAAGLDQKYAQEVVGDSTNGQIGPFETALGEFYTGNALPVAVGAFSEVNEDA